MKILVAHNFQGDIEHVLALPEEGPPAAVAPLQGQLVTEVETSSLHLDPAKPEGLDPIVEMIRGFRVDVGSHAQIKRK